MCKFNSRLFVFLVIVSLLILAVTARPATNRSLIDLLIDGNDYDLRYDQRQKGAENFRVKLDGFFFGIPAEPSSLFLMTDELVNVLGEELLLARHSDNRSPPSESNAAIQTQTPSSQFERQKSEIGTEPEDAETVELSQKSTPEGRDGLGQSSRTKVYLMNLLDYIRRNQHT